MLIYLGEEVQSGKVHALYEHYWEYGSWYRKVEEKDSSNGPQLVCD